MHLDAETQLQSPMAGAVADIVWADMALCRFAMGDIDVADSYVRSGMSTTGMLRHLVRPQLLIVRSLIAMARDDLEEARSVAEEADLLIEQKQMAHMRPIMAWAMGQVLAAEGDVEGALDRLGQGETVARQMGSRPWLGHILLLEASLLADLGRTAESAVKAEQRQSITNEIASDISDSGLRHSFLEASKGRPG